MVVGAGKSRPTKYAVHPSPLNTRDPTGDLGSPTGERQSTDVPVYAVAQPRVPDRWASGVWGEDPARGRTDSRQGLEPVHPAYAGGANAEQEPQHGLGQAALTPGARQPPTGPPTAQASPSHQSGATSPQLSRATGPHTRWHRQQRWRAWPRGRPAPPGPWAVRVRRGPAQGGIRRRCHRCRRSRRYLFRTRPLSHSERGTNCGKPRRGVGALARIHMPTPLIGCISRRRVP